MSEAERFFFDLFSIDYWDEDQAKQWKEYMDKQKFEREHKMEAPISFESHQELLRLARENTGSLSEDEAED